MYEQYYVFGLDDNVLYEEENGQYSEYIYVVGQYFARNDGNLLNDEITTYFYHTDHLGSTVMVTNEMGDIVWSTEYTPFGKVTMEEGLFDKAIKFTGKDIDEDTGLYYYNARWYDAEIGRFISEDPVKDGSNYYSYVNNNPLMFIDPDGQIPVSTLLIKAASGGATDLLAQIEI